MTIRYYSAVNTLSTIAGSQGDAPRTVHKQLIISRYTNL